MAAPTAISQDRIAATLKSMGVQYFREDSGEVRTAFPSLMVFFEVAEGGFKATARWLGIIEGDDIETLRLRCNEINRTMPLVRVHPVRREDDAVVLIDAPFFSNEGFTDEQVRAVLDYYFSAIHHVVNLLREALPDTSELLSTSGPKTFTTEANTEANAEANQED